MIEQTYKLNIIPRAEQAVRGMTPPTVNVSQYDKGLRALVFDLYDGSERMTIPAGQTAKIYGKKPDKNVFEYDMTVSEDRQSVSIILQEQMAVVAGCVECEVRIIDGSSTAGSANFILAVEKAPVGADEVYSDSKIPEIDNLLYGGEVGQVFTKTKTGARWDKIGTDSGFMMKFEYDPNDTGSVLKADHADDADTVDGHTVARDVLANEYTNKQIDSMMHAAGTVKTVNSVQPDQNGNVQLSKADIGLGNVDNTSDADKPISTATQAALDLKVDKVTGKGLSTNDYTDADKTKLAGIEAGAQVNTITGVKGDAETDYRTGNVNITKENIGLGNVDNTSDADKPISTAVQTALDGKQATLTFDNTPTAGSTNPVTSGGIAAEISALNSNLNQKVSSVNGETPDTNGNVEIDATGIETSSGVAIKSVNGNPVTIADALQGKALGVTATLEPIQSGSGTPSPTNIRPITGRTQVEISNKDSEDVEQASATVNLGQTVYGGTLDVTTGVLTVDRKCVDMGTMNWTYPQKDNQFYSNRIEDCKPGGWITDIMVSNYEINNRNYVQYPDPHARGITDRRMYIVDETFSGDVSAFTQSLAGQMLVYPLETPQTIQLTPAQLNLLTGANIITTNADDLLVRYYASGQTGNVEGNIAFLSEKTVSNETAVNTVSESIAPAETGTATQNYATGSYLMLNNRLCKVTAAIATGESIIVGSNVQYTTVAEELAAILAQISA